MSSRLKMEKIGYKLVTIYTCIGKSVLPSQLKLAEVIPLYKKSGIYDR